MQTKMTTLQEAADLETALGKIDEKHAKKLAALNEKKATDIKATRALYTTEANALLDKMNAEKGKAAQ